MNELVTARDQHGATIKVGSTCHALQDEAWLVRVTRITDGGEKLGPIIHCEMLGDGHGLKQGDGFITFGLMLDLVPTEGD